MKTSTEIMCGKPASTTQLIKELINYRNRIITLGRDSIKMPTVNTKSKSVVLLLY
jgi:hypothetical protein